MTQSLCATCLATIPAQIAEDDAGVWLNKECPVHGVDRVMVERSSEFYAALHRWQDPAPWRTKLDLCAIAVTNRCQIRCANCYEMPGNAPDPSIDDVLALVRLSKASKIMLMGAEPTVRNDLPELIAAIKAEGRRVVICTNALRLSDPAFVDRLAQAGLDAVCISHHPLDNPALLEKRAAAFAVLRAGALYVDHISFTADIADLPKVLTAAHGLWDLPEYFRLRVPARIGWHGEGATPFLSEYMPALERLCAQWGWPVEPMAADNGAYKFMLKIAGKPFRLIRWPTAHEIDLGELDCAPRSLFVPDIGEVNILHAIIVQEARKRLRRAA